ncbi:MAG TPA: HAD-IB family hydrolase [Solirubrobacteraceae bacterium]|jgi:putative phosphoserine phosphatase/1-acylglycerol-3-phosphate O-acyltransferase|nr:HAD-IB family hydrolase [Solirubrobacteraceae bacterium]
MTSIAEPLDRIYEAPAGPEVLACFDYDGTLIGGYSATVFYEHRMRSFDIGPIELTRTLLMGARGIRTEGDFESLLELSLAAWKGKTEDEVEGLGTKLFKSAIAARLHREAWELLQAHREMGHTLVLASSATRFQVTPMARELGIDHVLCTAVEVRDGRLTGHADGRPVWGEGKADALAALAQEHGIDLEQSFAYSNGEEDEPMLRSVGHPVAVEPTAKLRAVAERNGWPVVRCAPRGGRPGLLQMARTGGFFGALGGGMAIGAGVSLLTGSRRPIVDVTSLVGADVALAVAGVRVDVLEGVDYLWSARPCVFLFNHQSNIDPIVVMKLLGQGFTAVGKAEAKKIPFFGPMFQLAGVAFIDRADKEKALAALAPAVEKIKHDRLSLMIAPEGTRSRTPQLGPFKKGPFHIAMQAGVPVVPIVLNGAGEVLRKGDQTIRSGVVEVVVLPPVETDSWRRETMGEHVQEVRDQYVRTLADWPTRPARPRALEPGR